MKGVLFLALIALALAAQQFRSAHFDCASNGNCRSADWRKVGRVDASDLHTVMIAVGMKENARATCANEIEQISDPSSPRYGQFYTLEQIGEKFCDRAKTERVLLFLNKNGVASRNIVVSPNGDFITFTADVASIERMFSAQFYNFESPSLGKTIKRSATYALPSEVAKDIRFVGNTIRFPSTRTMVSVSKVDQANSATPALLSSYYNISSNTVSSGKATQAVFESLGQSFSPQDLTTFQNQFQLPKQPVVRVIGPNTPSDCAANPNNCAEASLDVQYMIAMAQGSPTTYWSIPQSVDDIFLAWIQAVAAASNPPLVHSISYGSLASEDDENDMESFNEEACKMGLRGLTIMVSSGDDGVANFDARNDPSQCGFQPSFPATSPYVTAVGATQGPEMNQPEIACASNTGGLITTGGGFSKVFTRPSYQAEAVQKYLSSAPNLPPTNLFASTGRGYPDVSMLGHNYIVVIGGQSYQVSGTSASSPVFAGLVSLINGLRLSAGKSALGFLNPAIYKIAKSQPNAFHDITVGENNCCAGEPGSIVCCQYGFNATSGWDPLTGWGSANFAVLSQALSSL